MTVNGADTNQQNIEANVRMIIGDLHVQLIVANAKIADLTAEIEALRGMAKQEVTLPEFENRQ